MVWASRVKLPLEAQGLEGGFKLGKSKGSSKGSISLGFREHSHPLDARGSQIHALNPQFPNVYQKLRPRSPALAPKLSMANTGTQRPFLSLPKATVSTNTTATLPSRRDLLRRHLLSREPQLSVLLTHTPRRVRRVLPLPSSKCTSTLAPGLHSHCAHGLQLKVLDLPRPPPVLGVRLGADSWRESAHWIPAPLPRSSPCHR